MSKSSTDGGGRVGTFLSAGIAAAVVVIAILGYRSLRATVAGAPRPPVRVAFNWPLVRDAQGRWTNWMSEPIRRSVERVALGNLTTDPLDSAALRLTAEALYSTGWFERPPTVSRAAGGRVEIVGQWRAPAAVVRLAEQDYLVSPSAQLLPLAFSTGTSGLKFIQNPYAPRPREAGAVWEGGDVEAALSLLALLQDTDAGAQVAGVDAARYITDKRLVIITDRGARVVWGAGPNDWAPAEPTKQVKLQRLLALRADAKFNFRIDADQGVIDLTNPRGVMIDATAAAALAAGAPPPALAMGALDTP